MLDWIFKGWKWNEEIPPRRGYTYNPPPDTLLPPPRPAVPPVPAH